MPKRKRRIEHDEIVRLFGAKLRETRLSRGMTQAELADKAKVTPTYIGRLESAGAAAGIDLVGKLAVALAVPISELLPTTAPPDTLALLRDQVRSLFESIMKAADRECLQMLAPLLARIDETLTRNR